MDTSDPKIFFNRAGVCSHCMQYDVVKKEILSSAKSQKMLETLANQIKATGKGARYDCIIGISGGIDSSYLAYIVKRKLGLRPLAVHLDNGWNSKLAAKNIRQIVNKLDIDLHTHVIDWEEFKDIQISYLKASVVDIEVVTDHAIFAAIYDVAEKTGVKYVLLGMNEVTEKILPRSWTFNKNDIINLKAIHKKFGKIPLNTYPLMGFNKYKYYKTKVGIVSHTPLDYMPYVKRDAVQVLIDELGWKDYGGKHYESVFTRFYQGYILPEKFGIDKRRAHLSTLINSGQVSREEALLELEKPPYEKELMEQDYEFVIKKFGFSREEFDNIMKLPIKSHFDYPTNLNSKLSRKVYPYLYRFYPVIRPVYKKLQKIFPFI